MFHKTKSELRSFPKTPKKHSLKKGSSYAVYVHNNLCTKKKKSSRAEIFLNYLFLFFWDFTFYSVSLEQIRGGL